MDDIIRESAVNEPLISNEDGGVKINLQRNRSLNDYYSSKQRSLSSNKLISEDDNYIDKFMQPSQPNQAQDKPNRLMTLKHSKSIRRMSKAVSRVSTRVVNLGNLSTITTATPKTDNASSPLKPSKQSNMNSQYSSLKKPLLEGYSLYIFSPKNPLRLGFYYILIINIILLIINAWNPYVDNPNGPTVPLNKWGNSWTDYGLLIVFIIFTFEIIARIIVSGLIFEPEDIEILDIDELNNYNNFHRETFYNTPFLRRSFNRIDILAVCSYWIDLLLTMVGVQHFLLFRALSTLRCARLLSLTSGTYTIFQSLKKSLPLLVNVSSFIGFFFIIFSILGVQAFRGSFSRRCVSSFNENGTLPDLNSQDYIIQDRFCGGYVDENGKTMPAVGSNLVYAKGFICPMNQILDNPYNDMVSFDNVLYSFILVFVISTTQNWSDLMYKIMDAEYDWSSLYFVIAVIILNYWLINLFVAVITTMFAKIHDNEGWKFNDDRQFYQQNPLNNILKQTHYVWILCIFIDIFIMAFKRSDLNGKSSSFIDHTEIAVTTILTFEILLRFFSFHPKYQFFFSSKQNLVDLFLVIATCTIQIPTIRNSTAYNYLTIFQIARVYRVLIAIPRLRDSLIRVLGSVAGIANLIFFTLMVNFFAAIFVIQLLRGVIPSNNPDGDSNVMRFSDIFNSFLALYQLFSGEDWTTVLYNVLNYESIIGSRVTALISAFFLIFYVSLSNFILLTMFIAVISENFDTAEKEKYKKQVESFRRNMNFSDKEEVTYKWNIYRYFQAKPKALAVQSFPSNLVLQIQKYRVRDFLFDNNHNKKQHFDKKNHQDSIVSFGMPNNFVTRIKRFFGFEIDSDEIYKIHLNGTKKRNSDFEKSRGITGNLDNEQKFSETFLDDYQERRALKADFIAAHPNYDLSLWSLSHNNRIRRFCQRLVPSSHGERIYGTPPSETLSFLFSSFIYICIIVSVVLATIAVPSYIKQYLAINDSYARFTWFWWTDVGLTIIFTIEFIIKIIADGFLLTPNAYMFNVWNQLDLFVLITFIVNTAIGPSVSSSSISKLFRALKGLRALRLINLTSSVKENFYSILISGAPRIFDAAVLSISLIIPFAIYGTNIFSGLFYQCNDFGVANKTQCIDVYNQSPFQWNILTSRIWSNPYGFSFDNFGVSLQILFEIVSGEGWVNVMERSMVISGIDLQPLPQPNSSPAKWNSLFFMVYNLVGAVFVLTLFVSVIIANYKSKSGTAYLTQEQKGWIDLKRLLKLIKPSKRPTNRPTSRFRGLCYDYASKKRGSFSNFITSIYIFHIILLMTENRTSIPWLDTLRVVLFFLFIMIYITELFIKLFGFGWNVFKSNRWNVFDIVIVFGALITTTSEMFHLFNSEIEIVPRIQKAFLLMITFKLFQKSDTMNQLFKNMIFGPNGSEHVNFRNFGNAMLTLVRMSTGTGWAYFLFITWNVLSMYIFANMFIVVVTENFSYCYQIADELSLVKRAWGSVDTERTGYIKSTDFGRFFSVCKRTNSKAKLEGSFRVRIYDDEFLVPNLIKNSRVVHTFNENTQLWGISSKRRRRVLEVGNLDVVKLERHLSRISYNKVCERRNVYNNIYQEALLSIEREANGNERGISFTNMLILLAHYKLVDDDKCLEKIQRERVVDNVNRERVKSLLLAIYWRGKYKKFKESQFSNHPNDSDDFVPQIMVDPVDRISNLTWDSIDANIEMDDQTANQMLTTFQSTHWHENLNESASQEHSDNNI
ncbi:2140_t:CDS:10 [Diversispora eburnea]|uniref:2140_t:CDS:1 n=1 Tax=Diversispora eburnea TaxID=1213867 RepID=A0A9N8VLL8_9GLOM|nr:2140_t:CDS:10 [Diversispora eburnea]